VSERMTGKKFFDQDFHSQSGSEYPLFRQSKGTGLAS